MGRERQYAGEAVQSQKSNASGRHAERVAEPHESKGHEEADEVSSIEQRYAPLIKAIAELYADDPDLCTYLKSIRVHSEAWDGTCETVATVVSHKAAVARDPCYAHEKSAFDYDSLGKADAGFRDGGRFHRR
jgi:hypothetical protein